MKRVLYAPLTSLLAFPVSCSQEDRPETATIDQRIELNPNCEPTTYQAEAMFHSTGGAVVDGWNIWDNGYISTTHTFEGGTTLMTVVARGASAVGVAPTMVVSIGGAQVFSTSIPSPEWAEYSFNVEAPAGPHEVRVRFTNDYYQNGQDRNLFVDELSIGCGTGLCGDGSVDPGEACDDGNEIDTDACNNLCTLSTSDGWTKLDLMNGWKQEANSHVPAVKLVDGIVTFRGGLDGAAATSLTAFCLTGPINGGTNFRQFAPTDGGSFEVRAALANGETGSLDISLDQPPGFGYCAGVDQDDMSAEPGPDARILTSLEGVTYDRSAANSIKVTAAGWKASYPHRGTDDSSNSPLPEAPGLYAKVVNGFVRFQGVAIAEGASVAPVVLTLPSGQGMIPAQTVYAPVGFSPASATTHGRVAIHPTGEVVVEGALEMALVGVALDGVAYSMSSPPGAQAIALSNGWTAESARAVRARAADGIVRLEGAVKGGSVPVIGTLPTNMRPSKTVYITAQALLFAQPSVVSVDPSGTIRVVSPAMVVADQGISLDGISFSHEPGTFVCSGACASATSLSRYVNSGPFGTTSERWFVVTDNISGWQASQVAGRTITVNGVVVTPGQLPLPAKVDGAYHFQFSGGSYTWASWSFW